jgi:hypothetical protein
MAMDPCRMIDPLLPEESSGDIVPLSRLGAELVRTGISYWRSLAGRQAFPGRASLISCLSPQLVANAILAEVIDGGADYEYRMLGSEVAKGFDTDFTGRRLSDLIETAPKFGLGLRMLYEMVRAGGEPLGYRGWMGNDAAGAGFVYHESVLLPLGEDGVVDNILTISVLVLRRAEAG